MQRIPRVTSLALILTLFVGPLSRAQPARPFQIQLRILAGDNASYETGSLQGKRLSVEVTDETGAPVAGVAVTFRLPEEGASGLFPDGNRSAVVNTTEQGQAAAPGIRWGTNPGTVSIRITAAKGSAHAGILVEQQLITAAAPPAGSRALSSSTPDARPARTIAGATTATKSANAPQPAAPPISSQVTILTQPAKPKPDPIASSSIAPLPTAAETKSEEPPAVTISGAPPGHGSSGKTKWILIGLAAAGAAAGIGIAMGGHKSAIATPTAPSTTIGAPSISIGHP